MGTFNRVILIGNLGRDCDLRFTAQGVPIATLSVATTEVWNDKAGNRQSKTEWHRVVVFGKQAESLASYLTKGKSIAVEGKLQTREWEKDGTKRYTTEVRSDRIVLLGSAPRENGGRHVPDEAVGHGEPSVPADGVPSSELTDDDIPF